jgi:hypothetical protein
MTEHVASRTLVKSPPELWAECSDAASLARHLDRFGEIRITRLDPETAVAWEGESARGTVRIEPAGWGTKVILTAVEVAGKVAEVLEEPAVVPEEPAVLDGPAVVPEEPAMLDGPAVVPEEPAVAVEAEIAEPDPEVVEADAEPAADPPARRRRFARLLGFLRGPEPTRDPEPPTPDEPAGAPDPPLPAEPAPPPRRPRVARAAATEAPATIATEAPATTAEPSATAPASSATAPEPPAAAPEPPVTEAALTAALDSLGQAHHRPYSRA